MMIFLKKIITYILNRIGWINYLYSMTKIAQTSGCLDLKNRKCVALIPHADDELLGLNSLIHNSEIRLIYLGYLGSNCSENNRIVRMEEFENFCKKTGCDYVLYTGGDLDIPKDIDIVFLPSIVDWHDEHRDVNYVLREYCEKHSIKPSIAWYNISVYYMFNKYAKYVRQTKQQHEGKFNLFKKMYPSQMKLPIMRFKIKDRLYGKEISSFAAEKFMCLSYSQWEKAIHIFEDDGLSKDASKIKEFLNDFDKVNKASRDLYNHILE